MITPLQARCAHVWAPYKPGGTMLRCSLCGVPELAWLARMEREAGEQVKAVMMQSLREEKGQR